VSKYADSLPLYRQSTILSRFGIEMNRTTLANWMIKCGELVQPLINRFEEQLLDQPYLHMDETPVQVLNEVGKSAESKSYMWVRSGGPPDKRLTLFDYDASRSGAVPKRLLAGYQGALMVDGYEGYQPVCREQALTRLGCWVHARRKFVDVSRASKKKNGQAAYAIKLIAKLYAVEKANKAASRDARYQAT
jgi:transposase